MERTWTLAGLLGEWHLIVRLEPEIEIVGDPVNRFESLDPHFVALVNLVEAESGYAGNSGRR